MAGIEIINQRVREESVFVTSLKQEVGKVIVGQSELIDRLIIGLLTNGHVLLEGVPGLAKTLTIQTLSQALATDFQRIQFTPDLLPADLIGTLIYNQKEGDFIIKKGPVFSNIILADEINRAPAKVQSALLEAMQERQVTIGEETFSLPKPFLVMATENPVEQEGTYPLPEAQLDRFMFAINLEYPTFEEEVSVVKHTTSTHSSLVDVVFDATAVLEFQSLIRRIPVADNVVEYAVSMISKTRPNTATASEKIQEFVSWGAGPRASQNLILAAKTHAVIHGKFSADIEDVQAVSKSVLRHRIIKNYKAEAEGVTVDTIIESLY